MVLVIEYVEEVSVEWMDVFDFGEVFEHVSDFFVQSLLTELDFPHVERSDSADGITWVDDCRGFSLCLRQNYIDKLCGRWNDLDCFEIVAHFLTMLKITFVYNKINS